MLTLDGLITALQELRDGCGGQVREMPGDSAVLIGTADGGYGLPLPTLDTDGNTVVIKIEQA